MTRRKKTDGERISTSILHCGYDEIRLAAEIDRLIRKRMAEAWEEGWFERLFRRKTLGENPYRGKRKK